MKKLLLGLMAMLGLVVFMACGSDDNRTSGNSSGANGASSDSDDLDRAALLAEYGITELNIGLMILDDNPEAGRANEEFRLALEEAIGIPVNEIEGVSHLIGLEAMRGGSLDLFMASPFTYLTGALNIDDLNVEFLATMHNPDADAGNTLFITAAENTHIETLADFEGESFAFVDTASLTGFLFPMYQLVSTLDLDHTQMLNPGYFFSTTILSGGHDASLMAVVNGDVGGAGVASVIIDHMIASGVIAEDDFSVIYEMEPGPEAGYIVRSDLPQFLIDDLRTFFLEYDDTEFFYNIHGSENARFVETDPANFEHLRGLMERLEIGLD